MSGQLWEVNNKESCLSSLLPSLHSLHVLLGWESCACVRVCVCVREGERREGVCVNKDADIYTLMPNV